LASLRDYCGSILGLVFGCGGYKTVRRYILNLLFTAIIPLIFFTIASSIASLEKSEKLGKLFVVVIGVFLSTVVISAVLMMVGVLLFPIHQDIIISTIPLESMKSASQGLKSQSCSLPMTFTNYCREKNVSFNYIFFLDWICLFAWRKGRSFRSFLSSGDEG
jgi:Na+/H+-dicarboxylate symporter